MHKSGKSVILNKHAGVTHQGAWLSNTYAWSAHKHGHGYKYGTTATATKYYTSSYDDFDPEGAAYGTYSNKYSSKALAWDAPVGEVRPKSDKKFNYDKVMRAAYNCYKRGSSQLVDWVITAPEKAEFLLLEWYGETYPQEMQEMVNIDPEEAALLIGDLFEGGSVNEGSLI
jgi:hypothetical protein